MRRAALEAGWSRPELKWYKGELGPTLETHLGLLPLPQALYLLLVTNKASNILEDLETLRLLAKVVPEYIDSLDEEVRVGGAHGMFYLGPDLIGNGHVG